MEQVDKLAVGMLDVGRENGRLVYEVPIRSAETLLVVLDDGGGGGGSSSSILLEVCSCVKFLEFSLLCSTAMTVRVACVHDASHRQQISDDTVGLTFLIKQSR